MWWRCVSRKQRESGPYVGERGDEVFRDSGLSRLPTTASNRGSGFVCWSIPGSRQLSFSREASHGSGEREKKEFLHPFDCFGLATLTRVFWPLRTFTVHPVGDRFSEQVAAWRGECFARQGLWRFMCNLINYKISESHEFHDFFTNILKMFYF